MKLSAVSLMVSGLLLAGCSHHTTGPRAEPAAVEPQAAAGQASAPQQGKTMLSQQQRDPAQFPAYLDQLKSDALAQGINAGVVEQAFAQTHFVDRVVSADRNQLENKVTLDDYLQRVLPPWKIAQAQEMYQRYQSQLAQVSARYGVPARYIVALWGMESGFGKIQGREDVISALSTLAFEGRREAFFKSELFAALRILQQNEVGIDQLKGSWAGAMGQSQFMPSSYLRYGADGDGDGKIDIWNNVMDVFASTANYLATEGWKPGQGWGQEIRLPAGFAPELAGLKDPQAKTVAAWSGQEIAALDGSPLAASSQRAWVIIPDDNQGRAFLVYDNFRTIMRWNRSYYFAISIGTLADAVEKTSPQ
ncbi:lytic transglycosylase domain-containing protein [Sodalis sp. RH21]|uniref:lytic murein transglycosylase n=1 Tax=unclassified Sodalis (in: enterobacteria) TaxID=2636512 RepID=UPI0039B45D62